MSTAPLFKGLARPPLYWGVPVKFVLFDLVFSLIVAVATGHFIKSIVFVGGGLYFLVYMLVEEHPTIFFQIGSMIRCKFRNWRTGYFGGAYYSPVNFKKSFKF